MLRSSVCYDYGPGERDPNGDFLPMLLDHDGAARKAFETSDEFPFNHPEADQLFLGAAIRNIKDNKSTPLHNLM
jgi:hypothetical protein